EAGAGSDALVGNKTQFVHRLRVPDRSQSRRRDKERSFQQAASSPMLGALGAVPGGPELAKSLVARQAGTLVLPLLLLRRRGSSWWSIIPVLAVSAGVRCPCLRSFRPRGFASCTLSKESTTTAPNCVARSPRARPA